MTKVELVLQESQRAFEVEWRRSESLTTKAEKYLVAVGLVIGFELIRLPPMLELTSTMHVAVAGYLALISILMLFLSFLYCLISLRTRPYLAYPRGETLINELKEEAINDDDAKIKVAKMYIAARDKNASINDSRAILLTRAGIILTGAFVLAVTSYLAMSLIKLGVTMP